MSAWPEPVERVAEFLRKVAVESRVEEFPAGTKTAEDAARAVGLVGLIDVAVKEHVTGEQRQLDAGAAAAVELRAGDEREEVADPAVRQVV